MFIPKANRNAIYTALYKDGVLVARKDHRPSMHCELKTIPNLQVIVTLKSLISRNYVKEKFVWNTYYWTLTNEGIIYLRDCLHFPPEVVPATLIRRERAVRDSTNCKAVRQEGFVQRRDSEGREMYRRQPNRYVDKRGDVGSGAGELQFRGGFGRGNQYD
uniref:Plectin/eS10 N-terminal domain-containing protein n=1 Tax=Anopheles coluzzii TaxID=1518534 RepID=A0A8W7PXP4_ANOCL